nr:immunoglobulin heavy chain junction region [Macaca mulatta]
CARDYGSAAFGSNRFDLW